MSAVVPGVFLLVIAVKATALIAAVLLLMRPMKRCSAALRHACLLGAMMGALLLPVLGAFLPALSPFRLTNSASPMNPELREWSDNAIDLILTRSDVFLSGSDVRAPIRLRSDWRALAERGTPALLIVWMTGLMMVLGRMAAGIIAADGWRARARLRGRVGRRVWVLESSEIVAPLTVGLVRPAILIPKGCDREPQAYRAMMTHELAHIERADCLTQCIVRFVCAIYWFNPLVWHVARCIALEQERACDDRVLTSGVDPILYSEVLIEAARDVVAKPMRMLLPSMAMPAHLERRIIGILDATATRTGLSATRVAAVTIATALVTVPLAALALEDRPPKSAALDPYFNPESERVPGLREWATPEPGPAGDALLLRLRTAAARDPESGQDLVPDRARWALPLGRGGNFIETLIDSLEHPDWRVRGYSAWVLGQSGDSRAIEPLTRLLDHPVWRLRAMAAAALRSIGDRRAIPALRRSLTDPAWQVRMEAAAFLGERDPSSRKFLEPLRDDQHMAVRVVVAQALNR